MAPLKEQEFVQVASPPKKKMIVKKKLTPRKGDLGSPVRANVSKVAPDPSSPPAHILLLGKPKNMFVMWGNHYLLVGWKFIGEHLIFWFVELLRQCL
jgi:hypothetical protein